ncbi:MAG TPA: tRNA (N6-isopentenyl adenosine(37)-C2)-methylthiotransferase MiaB [Spirochaetia bacterium]|nr:tRNA (N6-isopentenyl adenosine(37)-C2)-methylthiotransferase MiaB [Spirochaetia bacterium]
MTFFIEVYGCQMNVSDADNIRKMLAGCGHTETEHEEAAQIIILLTCAVRSSAEERIQGRLGYFKNKKKSRNFLLIFCGCIAEEKKGGILGAYPFIDLVIGTSELHNLPSAIAETEKISGQKIFTGDDYHFLSSGKSHIPGQAFVTIIHGCSNFCTYCIVPYTRGREKSRTADEIITEINQLEAEGIKEITLLGQNVNSYGLDLGQSPDFTGLLKKIINETNIPWVHFLTSHPKDFSEKLVCVLAENSRLTRYFHLPLQSGSNPVLSAMNRKYTIEQYLEKIDFIKKYIPDCTLSTDLLTGFPGESDEDFNETLKIMSAVRFDRAFMFKYSRRTFTRAAEYNNQVSAEIAQTRLEQIISLQTSISRENMQKKIGGIWTILVSGKSRKNGNIIGHSIHQRQVVVPAAAATGEFIKVTVKGISGETFTGEIISV